MFGFSFNMSKNEARKQLRRLDNKREKLLKIINGHVITEGDIENGVMVENQNGTIYTIRSEGFGIFNLYVNNGFLETKILPRSLRRYDLAVKLNDNGFKVLE